MISFVIQIILWKIKIPKYQSIIILVIFIINFIVLYVPFYLIFCNNFFLEKKFLAELIQVTIFYFGFTGAYLITFTAVEKDSPTIVLMMNIFTKGKKGISIKKIYSIITDYEFIKLRLDDLLFSKLIIYKKKKYFITKKGKKIIKLMYVFQKLINMNKKSS